MDEAAWEAYAYEQIGRIVVTWGTLDHAITSQTWKHNDPSSPFPAGPIERTFYKRWLRWCVIHEPHCKPAAAADFNAFRADVCKLSEHRDNLAHSVHEGLGVAGYTNDFRIMATHWSKPDWRQRFETWANKYAHLPIRARPNAPLGGTAHIYYRQEETAALLAGVRAALAGVRAISAAVGRGEQFAPPSTSIVPRALADLTPRIQ